MIKQIIDFLFRFYALNILWCFQDELSFTTIIASFQKFSGPLHARVVNIHDFTEEKKNEIHNECYR